MNNYTREEIREHTRRSRLRDKARRGEPIDVSDKELRDLLEFDARRENRFRDQVAARKRQRTRREAVARRREQERTAKEARRQRREEEKRAREIWIEQHPEEYRERIRERRRKSRGEKFIREQKENPCADCGKKYPSAVMDFHHCRGEKTANISAMKRYSLKRLQEEIAKCDLLCANCHRLRHISKSKSLDAAQQTTPT